MRKVNVCTVHVNKTSTSSSSLCLSTYLCVLLVKLNLLQSKKNINGNISQISGHFPPVMITLSVVMCWPSWASPQLLEASPAEVPPWGNPGEMVIAAHLVADVIQKSNQISLEARRGVEVRHAVSHELHNHNTHQDGQFDPAAGWGQTSLMDQLHTFLCQGFNAVQWKPRVSVGCKVGFPFAVEMVNRFDSSTCVKCPVQRLHHPDVHVQGRPGQTSIEDNNPACSLKIKL